MDQIAFCDHLKINAIAADMTEWSAMVDKVGEPQKQAFFKIALKLRISSYRMPTSPLLKP